MSTFRGLDDIRDIQYDVNKNLYNAKTAMQTFFAVCQCWFNSLTCVALNQTINRHVASQFYLNKQ